MKKKLPILLGAVALALVGCAGANENITDSQPEIEETNNIKVDSVKIKEVKETTVFDGSIVRLSATVNANQQGLKVRWESSNKNIATVVNGTVQFNTVSKDEEVTISAISRDDQTKKDSVTFKVKHCVLDLKNSRGVGLDYTNLINTGEISSKPGDFAYKFSDVFDTRWYVEAQFDITSMSDTDKFPKIGIMTGTDENASWNTSSANKTVKNAFFYLDTQAGLKDEGWDSYAFLGQNVHHTNWWWSNQSLAKSSTKFVMGGTHKMGLLRDGVNYYLYVDANGKMECIKHLVYTDIAEDQKSYAWIGGWNLGVKASEFKAFTGDEVSKLFEEPKDLSVASKTPYIYMGETYQIRPTSSTLNFDLAKVSYKSDNESVATVDKNGLVTAKNIKGNANITVSYGTLEQVITISVSDDPYDNVTLDGKMDDTIWSDVVKQNVYTFNHPEEKVLMDIYATQNNKGVYFFVDYESLNDASGAGEWWQSNNFELRMTNDKGLLKNEKAAALGNDNPNQLYAATAFGGISNFTEEAITAPKLNEATNRFEMSFELFVSYEALGVSPEERLGFTIGSNDGGNCWYSLDSFGSPRLVENLKISTEGINKYFPECAPDKHEYGEWVIEKEANCKQDGLKSKYCIWCHHKVSEVIPHGEHFFDMNNVIVDTKPTCSSKGTGHILCSGGCGEVKNVELGYDYTNHTGWDEEKHMCTGCGSLIKEPVLYDTMYEKAGWNVPNNWYKILNNLTGDFKYTIDYEMTVNGMRGNTWRGILPMIAEQLPEGMPGYGGPFITRMDSFGWVDQWESKQPLGKFEINEQHVKMNWWGEEEISDILGHCNISWTVSRIGNEIRNDFVITALDGKLAGNEYTYYTILKEVNPNTPVSIYFTAEFAKCNLNKIVKVQ